MVYFSEDEQKFTSEIGSSSSSSEGEQSQIVAEQGNKEVEKGEENISEMIELGENLLSSLNAYSARLNEALEIMDDWSLSKTVRYGVDLDLRGPDNRSFFSNLVAEGALMDKAKSAVEGDLVALHNAQKLFESGDASSAKILAMTIKKELLRELRDFTDRKLSTDLSKRFPRSLFSTPEVEWNVK